MVAAARAGAEAGAMAMAVGARGGVAEACH